MVKFTLSNYSVVDIVEADITTAIGLIDDNETVVVVPTADGKQLVIFSYV